MVEEKDKPNLNVTEGAFVKSEDKQVVPSSGVGDGVDFAESLPGGGSDNKAESSIKTGNEPEGFDHRLEDDARS